MTEPIITRTFTFEDEDTCKYGWTFTLKNNTLGWIIEDLQIDEREKPRGCSGHPQTIVALLKGRSLDSIHHQGLSEAACDRNISCGQALAKGLTALTAEQA